MKIQPIKSDFHLSNKTQKLINNITNPDYKPAEITKTIVKKTNLLQDFHLSNKTKQMIEKITKLSYDEIRDLSPDDARDLMIKRGSVKKQNPIKNFLKSIYQKIGEHFDLI